MDQLHRMLRVYTSHDGLLAALDANARKLAHARDSALPGPPSHFRRLRTKRSLLLTVLRANRLEARRLLSV